MEEKSKNERLTKTLNSLVQAKVDERISIREQKFKEGLETLKRIFPGVHGRIVDLIKPKDKKNEVAILTLLGKDLDAVLVNNESTAMECIKYLKDQRLGSTKFIPLNTISSVLIQDKYRHFEKANLAIDLIDYDNRFERALQYCCGNSIVCEDFNVARHICFELNQEVKAVTLNGTIIHRSGLITGGGAEIIGSTAATRRWEEKKLDELKREKEKLLNELNEIQKLKRRGNVEEVLNIKIQTLKANIQSLQEEKSKLSKDLISNGQEQTVLKNKQNKLQQDLNQKDLDKAKAEADVVRKEVYQEQDRIFSTFCSRLNLANIRDYENYRLKSTQSIVERNLKYKSAISVLENQ
ncbi:Smc hinge domain-containing protein [Neoconidiobolus thromboides FSU 785]|nr:Smc hinge domain-containing protein [Neoconidiobolus thromboides FSU 785]